MVEKIKSTLTYYHSSSLIVQSHATTQRCGAITVDGSGLCKRPTRFASTPKDSIGDPDSATLPNFKLLRRLLFSFSQHNHYYIPQQIHIMTKNCENSSNTANTRVLCCQSANLRVGVKLESQAYRYVLYVNNGHGRLSTPQIFLPFLRSVP